MFTPPSVTVSCVGCYRILNCNDAPSDENHTSNKYPNHFPTGFPDQCWVRLRGDAHKKNATRILASSTKMENNFAIFADELCPLYL